FASTAAARAASRPAAIVNLAWLVWFTAFAALQFMQYAQTIAAATFLLCIILYCAAFPGRALRALRGSALLWPIVTLALLSVTWSQFPDLTLRGAIQFALTTLGVVVVAQAVSPRQFVSMVWASCFVAMMASVAYLGPELLAQFSSGFPIQGIFLGS